MWRPFTSSGLPNRGKSKRIALRSSIRIATIAGIDIGVHYSWILVLVLVTWSLAEGFLPNSYSFAAPANWLVGTVGSLLLFASLLTHELAHSLVARARGFQVREVTLFLLGGVSNLESEPKSAKDEFIISAVGPLISLVLAVASGVLLVFAEEVPLVAPLLFYLSFINLLMAGFNLLPAFPLDGGRVLRSAIWAVTGSLYKATVLATFSGQGFGLLMIAVGVFEVFNPTLIGRLGGVWIVVIGWFLYRSALSSRRDIVADETKKLTAL